MNSAERLKQMKERSKLRRKLLAQQFGLKDELNFGNILGKKEDINQIVETKKNFSVLSSVPADTIQTTSSVEKNNSSDSKEKKVQILDNEDAVDSVYTDSKTFLKGTHSLNPHNDYCQHFIDSGYRPHNFIRDTGISDRFVEYPKLKELIKLKDEIIEQRATPPMYLHCDLDTYDLAELKYKFDVILIDPPLEEYQRRCPGLMFNWRPWRWEEIIRLEISQVAAQRSFCFLWCGSSEGLDEGRQCLKAWGFRRCEDICWIKTNKNNPGNTKYMEPMSVLQHTKEHCLMGIKGTVRRSTDGDFIHANVDLDIIIGEEPEYGSTEKPEEIFKIIEHFCLGRRRLHVFGNDHTVRPGWVTVGPDLTSSNYSSEQYNSFFSSTPEDYLVGSTDMIEQLRPKSPPAKIKNPTVGNTTRGRGRGDTQSYVRGVGVQRGGYSSRNYLAKPNYPS
ncbi:N6-adenosine-methyltransferase non-catalytic subunit-like [Hydra vulgaris]|uniref:N(6)-adenosine-methyltransferase non-catalytic subunit METTL14 n=1 Tax=Hydra vulgaris TaxID=6087 RepID=A0ABM4CPS7_HYDVU